MRKNLDITFMRFPIAFSAVIIVTCCSAYADGPSMDQEQFEIYVRTHKSQPALVELYKKAMAAFNQGKHKHAIKLFTELAKQDPKAVGAWTTLGTCHLWLEEYDKSIDCCTRAIALRPKDCDMYRRRALGYIALLKYSEALKDLDKGISVNPADSEIRKMRAECLKAEKRYPEAIADLNVILKRNPANEEVLHTKARIYIENKDWKNAIATYDSLNKYYPDDDHAIVERADCKMKLKDYKGAAADYNKAIAEDTENPEYAIKQRNLAYEKLGKKPGATPKSGSN